MTGAVGYSKAIILHFSDLWLDFNPVALSLPWILDVAFFPEPEPLFDKYYLYDDT